MKTAWLNLRGNVPDRSEAFIIGLKKIGYRVELGLCYEPRENSIAVMWNRIGTSHDVARRFEELGLPVLIAENAAWGNDFLGQRWYSLARNYHNTAGCFPISSTDRWDRLGVSLKPWRTSGEVVVLPQRSIGPPGVAMPRGWYAKGRIRPHPGLGKATDLEVDLANCGKVITWGSGAAVKALMWGIPVESHMPNWIAEQDNTEAGRLAMFQRLAWAQFRLEEFASGEAFARMLS